MLLAKRLNSVHYWYILNEYLSVEALKRELLLMGLYAHRLYPTRFREILDYKNGGFVFYPEGKGREWSFHAPRMSQFLDKHFSDIFQESVKEK